MWPAGRKLGVDSTWHFLQESGGLISPWHARQSAMRGKCAAVFFPCGTSPLSGMPPWQTVQGSWTFARDSTDGG